MAKEVKTQNYSTLKRHATGLIVGLTLQYILGMITTIFVKFPEDKHEGELWQFAWSQIPLALHIILGFLLLFGSLALLVRATRTHNRLWIATSGIGFGFIFISAVVGSKFIPTQQEIYSFVMSLGFIGAMLSYFWAIYRFK
jgi:hypothetical protein